MKITKTKFEDLLLLNHDFFKDKRGLFKEVFRLNQLENVLGYKLHFCQNNIVHSNKMVLRGLHFQSNQHSQSKLIHVLSGSILDVAVDIRKNSKTYGNYYKKEISSDDNLSLFIPKGFAHGYLALEDKTVIQYSVDKYYFQDSQRGIAFNDKFLSIDWGYGEKEIIISQRDKNYKPFKW